MKFIVALCAFALVFCFIGEAKADDEPGIPTILLPEKECVKRTFSDDGTSLTEIGCDEFNCGPGKTTKITEDKTKPYPDCCPQIKCIDELE